MKIHCDPEYTRRMLQELTATATSFSHRLDDFPLSDATSPPPPPATEFLRATVAACTSVLAAQQQLCGDVQAWGHRAELLLHAIEGTDAAGARHLNHLVEG